MRADRTTLLIMIIIAIVLLYLFLPLADKPFARHLQWAKVNPGLDLAGGAELVYKVESGKKEDTVKAQTIVQRRLGALKEASVHTKGDDSLLIQIPGIKTTEELDRYKRMIERTGSLEWREVIPKEELDRYSPDEYEQLKSREGEDLYVKKQNVVVGQDIESAFVEFSRGQWVIAFTLKSGIPTDKFAEVTEKLAGKGRIAIVLDKKEIVSAPAVKAKIIGRGVIELGGSPREEADQLAIILRHGELPSPLQFVSQNFMGALLGEDQIKRGIIAAIAGCAAVIVFMFIYYSSGAFCTLFTLLINICYLLGILAIFNATITLPGLAGLVIMIGMAIDGNILIFERIREELAKGKHLAQAIETSFNRVGVTIFDANSTTGIIALLLWLVGLGPVKAFGLILLLGIIINMIVIMVGTRALMRSLVLSGTLKQFRMVALLTNLKFPFARYFSLGVIISLLCVIISIVLIITSFERNLGFDFKGGVLVTFKCREKMSIEEARAKITALKKYPDLGLTQFNVPGYEGSLFQFRTGLQETKELTQLLDEVKNDISTAFADKINPGAFRELTKQELKEKFKDLVLEHEKSTPAAAIYVNIITDNIEETKKKIVNILKEIPELTKAGIEKTIYERIETKLEKVGYLIPYAEEHPNRYRFTLAVPKGEEQKLQEIKKQLENLRNELPFIEEPFAPIPEEEVKKIQTNPEYMFEIEHSTPETGLTIICSSSPGIPQNSFLTDFKNRIIGAISNIPELVNPKTNRSIYIKLLPDVTEFTCKVEKKEHRALVKDTLTKRVKNIQSITETGDDSLIIKIPKLETEKIEEIKLLITSTGSVSVAEVIPDQEIKNYKPDDYIIISNLHVKKEPLVTDADIIQIEQTTSDTGWAVLVSLRSDASQKLERSTQVAVILDNREIISQSVSTTAEGKWKVVSTTSEDKLLICLNKLPSGVSVVSARDIPKEKQYPVPVQLTSGGNVIKYFLFMPGGLSENVIEKVKDAIKNLTYAISLSPGPIQDLASWEIDRIQLGQYQDIKAGAGFYFRIYKNGVKPEQVVEKLIGIIKNAGLAEEIYYQMQLKDFTTYLIPNTKIVKGFESFVVSIPEDTPENIQKLSDTIKQKLKERHEKGEIKLADEPFEYIGAVGAIATQELRDTAVWAILLGCILMLIYIAIRFVSFNFGIGAIIALIHDVVISIGIMFAIRMLYTGGLELGLEFNMQTVAAVLTIIGYSINDTIVIYDRVRENIISMRRIGFADILTTSLNQVASRSIMTSFTTLLTVAVLFGLTIGTGSGIPNLAFPLLIGIIVGTYSSFFIAIPVSYWLLGKKKPEIIRK